MDFKTLAAVRFVAGLGAGLALAIGNATIANARDAEQFSGHLTILLVAFMVVIMPVFSRVSETYGYQGVFAALAVTVLVGAVSMLFLPNEPSFASGADPAAGESGPSSALLSMTGIAVLAVAFLFGARDTLPWLVAEQLGLDAGMSLPEIGNLFSLMYAVSIVGPAILLYLSRRFEGQTLLAWTMGLTGLFAWLFTVSDGNRMLFSSGIVIWATIYFMAFALLNAVAAMLDRSGRLVSAIGSSFIAGVTVAPFFGGYLVDQGGYTSLGMAELTLTAIVVALILIALRGRHLKPSEAQTAS
ncbi:MAG: MFS transporter [Pseudomonadota bacterium]